MPESLDHAVALITEGLLTQLPTQLITAVVIAAAGVWVRRRTRTPAKPAVRSGETQGCQHSPPQRISNAHAPLQEAWPVGRETSRGCSRWRARTADTLLVRDAQTVLTSGSAGGTSRWLPPVGELDLAEPGAEGVGEREH